MSKHLFFLFTILILSSSGFAYGETMRAYLLADGEAGGNEDDEIIAENNQPIDLSDDVQTVPKTTKTIGGIQVDLTKEVEFVATAGNVVTLKNTALPTTTVEIPNRAIVSGPTAWNGEITPPKQITTSGSVPANFQTPTTSIQMGSPDVILVFDKAVTILLTGITGQTAYKTPGSSTWILISTCAGTYANPTDPPVNGECSISNGVNTKILTFHFTEFSGLSSTPASSPAAASTPSTSSSGSSGGHGRTGVGPTSGGGNYIAPIQQSSNGKIPAWFSDVIHWQQQGLITTDEMLKAYKWIMANIVK